MNFKSRFFAVVAMAALCAGLASSQSLSQTLALNPQPEPPGAHGGLIRGGGLPKANVMPTKFVA